MTIERNYVTQIDTPEKEMARDRIIANLAWGMEDWTRKEGFLLVQPNHLTTVTGACESISSLMKVTNLDVDFPVFLSQSGQLRLESLTQKYGKIYCWLQSFRKEQRPDGRRLWNFPLFEIEHLGGFEELRKNVESITKAGIDNVLANCEKELVIIGRDIKELENFKLDRITYEDAISLLNDAGYPDLKFGDDLVAEHEQRVVDLIGNCTIEKYEKSIKFFNMIDNPCDNRTVLSFDMILNKAGESAGAAERAIIGDNIKEKLLTSSMYKHLLEEGLTYEDFKWYIDFHYENKVLQHSGAGLGFARISQFTLGVDNIKDALTFATDSSQVW